MHRGRELQEGTSRKRRELQVKLVPPQLVQIFSYEREMDALNIIWERKDKLDFILTNVHRTDANRFGIIEHIEKEFKLQIILMSPDIEDIKNVSRGSGNGGTVYIMNSLSMNEINNLWSNALAREKVKRELSSENLLQKGVEKASSSGFSEAIEDFGKRKSTREINEQIGSKKDEPNAEKKPRVVWTKEMHQKFVEAVSQLGPDKAFPKKIVELMKVPGLTRENVASHLQKYRMCIKRAQEGFTGSLYGLNLTNDFCSYGFNTFDQHFQQSHLNPFRMGPFGTTLSISNSTPVGLTNYGSNLRLSESSLTNYRRNYRVYGDDRKNVLLSVENNMVPRKNTSFVGFRLTGDGKSVEFGQNGHLLEDGGLVKVNENSISFNSQKNDSILQMGNDDFTHSPLFPVSMTPQPSSSVMPPEYSVAPPWTGCDVTQSALAPVETDRNKVAAQLDSSVAPLFDWDFPASFTPASDWNEVAAQPESSIAPPQTDWDFPASFTPQVQHSVSPLLNDVNDNSEVYSDFNSMTLPQLEFEPGSFGIEDDDGAEIEKIAKCLFDQGDFDDLFFDC